ncbi:MAG TPA: C39 family peptidase [Symbiobacteriaceae bacterium]|nr:C39 family peptidase [Symbiobacteriaceae bacterium]
MKRVVLAVVSVFAVTIAALFIYININTAPLADASHIAAEIGGLEPKVVRVDGVKLQAQPDPYTCGITTISVMASFFGKQDVTPQALIAKHSLGGGMTTAQFGELLAQELPGYTVGYRGKGNDSVMIQELHAQLKQGIPVPVFFGAPNPHNQPYYDFHASIVTGLDLAAGQVEIANVYGYQEKLSLVDFLNRMAYRDTKNYPLVQRGVLKFGLMEKNVLYLVHRAP